MMIIDINDKINQLSKHQINEELNKSGFIWIKNSGITSAEDFDHHHEKFISQPMNYLEGDAIRGQASKNILTAFSESDDKSDKIELHQELANASKFPQRIIFYCQLPAVKGGESIIADMTKVTHDLPSALFKKILQKKGMFQTFFLDEESDNSGYDFLFRSWQDAFKADSKLQVEKKAIELGCTITWHDNNIMRLQKILPNTISINNNQSIFFNQIFFYDAYYNDNFKIITKFQDKFNLPHCYGYCWEDGSIISKDDINLIAHAYNKNEQTMLLAAGDVLVLNNILYSHGRLPFEGERKVFVLMGDP